MIELALFQPEIPPNTGNLIRLVANIGTSLHLIHPLGFSLDQKQLRRAGLDYQKWAHVIEHIDFDKFQKAQAEKRIIVCETFGRACYSDFKFSVNDIILLGSETAGLPETFLAHCADSVFLPMKTTERSLNLSNAAAIVMYEAWRQLGFKRGE